MFFVFKWYKRNRIALKTLMALELLWYKAFFHTTWELLQEMISFWGQRVLGLPLTHPVTDWELACLFELQSPHIYWENWFLLVQTILICILSWVQRMGFLWAMDCHCWYGTRNRWWQSVFTAWRSRLRGNIPHNFLLISSTYLHWTWAKWSNVKRSEDKNTCLGITCCIR